MTSSQPWESDTDVAQSVETVRTNLFQSLRRTPPRRRLLVTLGAAIAGLGLFAGGIAFGAVAYASPSRVAATTTSPTTSPTSSALSISCFTSATATTFSSIQEYQSPTNTASQLLLEAAKANPAQTCVTQLNQQSELQKFGQQLANGTLTGLDCGTITANTLPPFYFELKGGTFQQSGGVITASGQYGFGVVLLNNGKETVYTGSFYPPTTPLPSSCSAITLPNIPALTAAKLGVCRVDAKHVNVYPLGPRTVASLCKLHGYKPWSI